MPMYRYPQPPITVADLFCSAVEVEPLLLPAWWPGDKQLELTFQPPAGAAAELEARR
jgi:hypothetical protein